ncbi:hypothetical protein PVAP13_1NG181919 [Panicum virgatum]|uniref:Secreted protein n=1 Tax=Panicum virgatum TaxID=38727 RepID=A0A8T0WPS3_PANVG|nr:hypothetical protein PVAP13_1NG181919 [Panicum virgatum]
MVHLQQILALLVRCTPASASAISTDHRRQVKVMGGYPNPRLEKRCPASANLFCAACATSRVEATPVYSLVAPAVTVHTW